MKLGEIQESVDSYSNKSERESNDHYSDVVKEAFQEVYIHNRPPLEYFTWTVGLSSGASCAGRKGES
jgi:hypothetical protein